MNLILNRPIIFKKGRGVQKSVLPQSCKIFVIHNQTLK